MALEPRAHCVAQYPLCDPCFSLLMACLRGGGRLRRLTTTGFGTSDPFPPLPMVRPADVPDLYLERQREAFCGLHALNAALGSPVFTQEDIDCAAQRVLDCAIAAAMNNTESCEETLARHRSPAGMYSEQALGEALAHDGRWRMDDQSWYLPPVDALALMPRDDIVGAIAYTPGHWVALRTVDGGLWLLDSLKRWPQRLGSVGDPAAKAFLESCERVFLLCSDQGVAPTNQELADGTPGSAAAMAEASRLSPPPPEVATSKAQPRVSRSRSPRRELAPCDHALPAVLPDGARGVRSHAEQLLQVYASGGDARHFLRSLPLVHPDVAALTPELSLHLSALGLDGLAENRLAAAEALRLSTPLWRTTAYPLAVLCEAMSIAQGMPAVFYHDTFLALFGSLLHKDLAVSIGGWECRSRFWVVGTADPGGGKSAAVDPMRDLLDSVLQEFPDLAPGSRFGRFHFCGPCTHAAAADRLRENDGYLAVVSGEAGPLLCPSWASSLRWEPRGYMNLSKFLDAAGGGSFQWETKNDRGVKRRGAATEEEERGCIDIARTNVSFALFQQVSIFTDWWARSESVHPIGLAPRFLFAFGSSLPPTHARHARFVQEVAFPLLADVWRQLLRVLGPRVPVTTKHPCRQWTLGGDAEDFVLRLRTLCHDTGRKLSGRSIVATALTKVNYILGQQCLLQELLAQLLPAALAASTVPTELRPVVQWHTLSLAWEFARLRYLFGQAVLDQDIRQQSWAISGGVPEVFAGATTHQRQAALVLRHCTGQEIAVDDMADVGPPFRAARSSSQHLRSAALGAAASLFEHMALAGLGAVVHSESGHAVFQKQHWQHLSDEAKGYLHRARVPPWTFGYGILQAREKLQQRQAAATTPVALHCVTAADRQSTAHGDGASHADAGTHLAAGTASAGQPIVEAAEPTDVDAGTQTSSVPTTHTLSLPAPRRIPGLWDGLSMAELRTRPASREVVSQGGTMQLPTTEQTAAAAVATTQPMPRFAWLREAGDHLWSRSDVRALIGQRLKEENVRAEVTLRGETAYVWRFRARCSQPQCLWQWNVQYFFRRQGHPPGTLLAYSIGDHSHATLTTTAASGRIFTPRQQQAAEEYVAGSSRRSARQLRAFLDSRGESGLPTDTQLSEWLRRAAKRQKQAEGGREQPESQHVVAVVAESVERWVRDAGEQPEELFVLRSFKLSGDAAFVPFLSSGMVATMARLRDADVCLVVDTKMGVLDKGWGIATVSVLVKDALRMTTLSRDSRPLVSGEGASRAQGTRRVQGRAWTSHAMPLLQAIIHSESASNYIALFEQLEHVWAGARFNDKPLKEHDALGKSKNEFQCRLGGSGEALESDFE